MDFVLARRMMVDGQVRTRDVFDTNLLAAMGEVPRERFVPPEQAGLAYLDRNVPLAAQGSGQASRCLLQPMVLAHLLQAADIAEHEGVLVVGCATGYTAAVVARVAGTVVALEEDRTLAVTARRVLGEFAPAVKVVEGPLQAGWPEFGPYDVIVIEGAVEVIPPALFGQLKDGGRLVTIDGVRPGAKAAVYCSVKGDVSCRPLIEAAAPLLPGFAKPPAFVF